MAAKGFVKRLLVLDASKRLSAAQALADPWLRQWAPDAPSLDTEVVERLRGAVSLPPLRRVCISIAARHLSAEHLQGLCNQFHTLDADHKGSISIKDFQQAIGEVKAAQFANVDLNNDGEIGFNSFIAAALPKESQFDVFRAVFDCLDFDRAGRISERNLRTLLGDEFDGVPVSELIREADPDGHGSVNFDQFLAYMAKGDVTADTASLVCSERNIKGDDSRSNRSCSIQ